MDFSFGEAAESLRDEVKAFLCRELPPELDEQFYRSGISHDDGFARALAARGWIGANWEPDDRDEAARQLDPYELHVLTDELTQAEAPIYATTTSVMVARLIAAVGPEEMKAEILPRVRAGETTIALGQSEPEAGSDVASVRTRGRWDGSVWVIDGQKMFTTNGHLTDYVFLLVRTNPDAPKHAGLTTFLLPCNLPGFEAQAVYTLSGERTNITFYNGVRLDDRWRIGEVDCGWQQLMVALQDEHSAGFVVHLARLLEAVEGWSQEAEDENGERPLDNPDVQVRLANWATRLEVAQLLEARTTWMEAQGKTPVAEGPMAKLFGTEAVVRGAEDLTEMVGPDALRSRLDPTALEGGRIEHALRFSLGTTIYAGTSEIQRNIIARFACGLPR
jgi:3-oxocholest-4-en-26-oyl-CoA dehydrogenase alpha subunit